ncbi:M20/M25/M40 family metallo-hydrolase [Singulisphaera acidiphila]|uniref:Putative aminopeptidase n=1 Tax=Singulisphaera acidiphila (strain ATCC BAA-1392 / DSM 18658 / VKM B-2454 / MOB10) TaxID=886293 RepID=L0DNP6_SINAD|nr:M20/M25/M40 family metallo-hydrolase [Singulisphaera acidiphila]AGA30862.1 putative aminopeptidase [Singulisphaera acidiphila DSM 18658]
MHVSIRHRVMWPALAPAILALACSWQAVHAEDRSPSPAEIRLKSDVSYLADDAREGRGPGTQGIEAAADYIAAEFKQIGLKPAAGADGYFQPFTISGSPTLGTPLNLSLTGPEGKALKADPKTDFQPLAIGTGGTLKDVPLVFAGYGISAKDAARKLDYDDYNGLDVKGKAVLLIRREPRQDKDDSPFDGKRDSSFASFRHKATNAFQHGAAAVLLVNDAYTLQGKKDELLAFGAAGTEPNSTLPFLMVSREFANRLLAETGQPNLETLEKEIDTDLKPRSRELKGWKVDAQVEIERKDLVTKNVVGVLEGSGPLAEETIVIGAHYDHLGRGGLFSGSLAFLSKDIHNGADDNASGTALVMEMARRLARRADPLPRRVVFMAFSGEERGLLGSRHYVEHPLYPLTSTIMMVNFDMVGRLNDKDELTIYGTGTTPGAEALVDALAQSSGFKLKKIAEGLGPSDQQSFYLKDIPVLFAFTGTHRDYHRPSDDTDLINFAGMSRIADFAELLLLDLARRPQRPEFTKVVRKGSQGGHGGDVDPGRVSISAYLGSIPDYDDNVKGVKLSGVREGSPAEKGGLKADDIVVGFGGKPVATIYDYTESLGRYKPGDVVDVVVKRNGKEETLKITLGNRPSE